MPSSTGKMTPRERFLAVARFQTPDYVPIFGFPGAPGMAGGCMKLTHDRLVATGMPADVGGAYGPGYRQQDHESWWRYWGTTGPIFPGFSVAGGAEGFETTRRVEGEFEILESESGEITRQLVDNDITYSMPEFVRYPVRDRESWEFYKQRTEPKTFMSAEEIEQRCRELDNRDMPLCVGGLWTYGHIRALMGPEGASLAFYDDPELVHDIIDTELRRRRETAFPLIERLKPDIVSTGEDLCYNHGMLLSPKHFEEFCAPAYRELCDLAHSVGAVVATDTDGNIMEFADLAVDVGIDAIFPCEVKAGNDLFELRRRHPKLILMGWLEKETVNEGNGRLIENEILSKVPPLLEQGGYFPNGDHGIQPPVTFDNLCKFMTLLHQVCDNPEGEFPRK